MRGSGLVLVWLFTLQQQKIVTGSRPQISQLISSFGAVQWSPGLIICKDYEVMAGGILNERD